MIIKENINGFELSFETDQDSFSPLAIDKGTLAMLSIVNFQSSDKLLDLGCGYGVVGIYAAKILDEQNVFLSDIDTKSVNLSLKNVAANGVDAVKVIQSDCFDNIQESDFSLILSNPPYHSDFSVPKCFIEKGFNRLIIGGKMYMVTKRKDWYKNKFIAIFGGVKINEVDEYYIFCAEKRNKQYAHKAHKRNSPS